MTVFSVKRLAIYYEYLPKGIARLFILRKFHILRSMGKKIGYTLVVFVLSILAVHGQNEKKLDSLISAADSFYRNGNYTSALTHNLDAITLIRKETGNNYFQGVAPLVMLNTGKCYKQLGEVKNAHRFMTYSLQLARANKVHDDIEAAFIELNLLHKYISTENIVFDYPEVPATEESAMFYVIDKVERISSDSIRIVIRGGRYDGIIDSVKKGGVISQYAKGEKERPF